MTNLAFGPFRLDTHGGVLLRGTEPVALGRRATALLQALVERPGVLVSRDALFEAAWPGLAVDDTNLAVQIAALRRALGEVPGGDRWIETMFGRGYRFVGPVAASGETSVVAPLVDASQAGVLRVPEATPRGGASRNGSLTLAPSTAPAKPAWPLPDKPSIAVLPFDNMSGDAGQSYFVDGMVEEIITALSRIRWLFVVARNSSFTYKGRTVDVKQAGRELGVRYVLEGSVRKTGNRVRITAQLIDALGGEHLWADRFDGSLGDIFDLQDKVALSVAGVIEPTLQAAEIARSGSRSTADLTAYDLYLRAYAILVSSAARTPEALRLLEQAIERDPGYGPALTWAAVCCYALVIDGRSEDVATDRGKGVAFARRALDVAADDPGILANAALALGYFGEDIGAMMALVDRALALNPSYARGWHVSGILRLFAGQADIAIEHVEAALRLSPRVRVGWAFNVIGAAHFFARRFDEAVPKLQLAIQEDQGNPTPHHLLAACYAQMGRRADAREVAERLPAITSLVIPDLSFLRNAEHRELLLTGLRLATGEPPAGPARAAPTSDDHAERRQITALSCEMIGMSGRAHGTDLEDLRETARAFERCVAETVDRYDGFVISRMGNVQLVLFGHPAVHEYDAERAVRAALELCAAVGTLRPGRDVPMRCRVGIATGLAIIGHAGQSSTLPDFEIVGETPDLAARLRLSAEPDIVTIDPATRHLIGNLFDCRDAGTIDTTGGTEPVRIWQVLGANLAASRFEALRPAALAPLVGRDEEIDLLLRRWQRAKAGNGQVMLISGEPGIGKSRIVAAFAARLQDEPYRRLSYFCSPHHQDSALFPCIDQLSHAARFARNDSPATRLKKLEAMLARAEPLDEDVAFIIDLLSLPASERHPLPNLSPQRKKHKTLEALTRQLEGLARRQPVVVLFEDAHWIDPTSRELLDLTVERVPSLPVLLIVTFRPQFQAPWTGQPQVTMLALNRLDGRDRMALVEQIAGGKSLPDEIVVQIVDRTDGVPLFVEELTKNVLESDLLREEVDRYVLDRPLPTLGIPTTLRASLMARLDRLASVRRVAQIGAAIGRQFSYELLRAVSRLPEDELGASLGRLVTSELVSQRGTPPEAVYSFKHALVQDAAHGSLLRDARRQLHAHIAEALEAQSPELMDNQPELFAQHYAEAGLVEQSVAYWGKAGHRSAARSEMAEAAAQFQKGLDQLSLLPDSRERQQQELEFCSGLGAVLRWVRGPATPETGEAYARARELWERLGSPSEFIQVPYLEAAYRAIHGELNQAQRLAQDLLDLSSRLGNSGGVVLGHSISGITHLLAGRFAVSQSHLEALLALYDPICHSALVHQAGSHPLATQVFLGNALFYQGFVDQGLARINAAIADARRLANPATLAVSLGFSAMQLSLSGDNALLAERADELVAVATEQGFPWWRAAGAIFRGWVKTEDGDVASGISLLRSGSAAYCATGAVMWMPRFVALLARACEIAGQIDEAATLFDEALQIVERTGERWFEAELHRHKGQLLLRQGQSEAAEELYRHALSIAREQDAKLWQLRAAGDLARLRRDQSHRAEARELLAPIYNWFSEGFDTADLTEAKALLDELA